MNRLGIATLAVTLTATASLAAQVPADTATLAPVIVTADRRAMPAADVTTAVTVITGAELRERGIRFVADALRDVPGLALAQVGSMGGVTSLFTRGGNSNYTKVLIDGVPVNQSGGAYDFADLTTTDIERIEIVRGPASVIYGSDAVSGVVQIFTRQGTGPARIEAGIEAGSRHASDAQLSASGGGTGGGYALGFSRFDADGNYPFNSHYRNGTITGAAHAAPDSLTMAALTMRYTERSYRFPTDGAGNLTDSNQVSNTDRVVLGVDATRRLRRDLEARLALALHSGDDAFVDMPDGPADSTGFAFASRRNAFTSRRSADLRLVFRPGRRLVLTAGSQVELERERQGSETTSNFGGGAGSDAAFFDEARHTWAGYAQASAGIAPGLSADLGVRLDDNSTFGTFVTARAGVVQRIADTRLRVSAGNAFKAPTFSETFAATPYEAGNPSLRPERATSWDAGVEQSLAGGLAVIGVTYFDQRFRDLIQYIPAAPGAPTYANLAAANARGLEATAEIRPIPAVSLAAQYTGLRTRVANAGASSSVAFQAGAALLRRPAHAGRIGVRARAGARAMLTASLDLTGPREDVDFRPYPEVRVTLPAYHTVELAGELGLARDERGADRVMVTARVRNLFDAQYEEVLGFPALGRTVAVGARVRM